MNFGLIKDNLNITLSKTAQTNFINFEQLFKFYNSHTNLISKNDEINLFEKHIYDSLCLNLFLSKYGFVDIQTKILDIGTGGGFPAVPLAIAFDNLEIYPIDSIAKKIGFIELVQKELRLGNIFPICKRVEELPLKDKGSFDIVTSRAVASLNLLLEYAIPYVKTGGYFVAFKSKLADEEIENAQNALEVLNVKIVDRIKYSIPLAEDFTRELIVIKKEQSTPAIYPRKSGMAKKRPL